MLRLSASPLSAGFFAFGLLISSQASAYCRTTTAPQPPESAGCPGLCVTDGTPLYWPKAETQYAFNVRPFAGFTDANLRRIIAASFGAWTSVECPATSEQGATTQVPVGLVATAKPGTTTDEVGPQDKEPNDNAIVFFSGADWIAHDYDERAFALTSLWFYDSGEIIGADMHFNGAMNFGECPPQGCSANRSVADLQNVATHEAGHYFGLAHSDRDTATMWCDASPGQVDKRTLSPDDIAGLCDIYPPGKAFMDEPATGSRDDSRCSAAPYGRRAPTGLVWLALLGLSLLARRVRASLGRASARVDATLEQD